MKKAVFIDKDGTLITDVPYNIDVSLIKFYDGAFDALSQLSKQGYLLIIISNQSGIAYNYFNEEDLLKVKEHICAELSLQGITLSGFYYCPHHPQGINIKFAMECDCRKPLPGMIFKASKDLQIDLKSSWMIGDILNDIEAGNRAGCNTILIDNGNETEWIINKERTATYKATDLLDAAAYILDHQP